MSGRNESQRTLRDQAASWTMLVESGELLPECQLHDFHVWLEVPRNARAFQEYRSMVSLIQELPREKRARLVALSERQSRLSALAGLFDYPFKLSAIAATLVAFAVFIAWSTLRPVREFASETYTTGTGEARTIVLRDGSLAHLNTQSSLRWIGSGKERRVVLEKGEVLFEVSHDPRRPFCVTVGNSEICDLATQFDVYRKANGSVVVTVLSGQVAVKEITAKGELPAWSERLVNPNEQMEYTPAAVIADVHSVSAAKAVRWREGLLETEGQSFAAIVSELNRYSTKQILIADPRLQAAEFKIGGRFSIHNVPKALEHIQQLESIVVTDTGDSYVLSYKAEASATGRPNAGQQNVAVQP
jgi:transmembrane sensor